MIRPMPYDASGHLKFISKGPSASDHKLLSVDAGPVKLSILCVWLCHRSEIVGQLEVKSRGMSMFIKELCRLAVEPWAGIISGMDVIFCPTVPP